MRKEPDGRRIAFEVLLRIVRGGAWSGVTLDAAFEERPALDQREKALATELVYGSLRMAPALDAILARHVKRPIDTVDQKILVILRLGAYQLLHMRVPDYAAVGESVQMAREVGAGGLCAFVNGVLRSLSRDTSFQPPSLDENPEQHLLFAHALPPWLYREWKTDLPLEEILQFAKALNSPARSTLRAPSREDRDLLMHRLGESGVRVAPTELSPLGIVIEGGIHPAHIPDWDTLKLQSQDEGAQLVTEFALLPSGNSSDGKGREPKVSSFQNILDACAAPGGKTCHLAQALPASKVVALELHKRRAARVIEETQRLALSDQVLVHAADATKPLNFLKKDFFNLVMVDAPCTGFGTLRRNPEIKLTRNEEDAGRLAELQIRLLLNLADYVADSGRLVYAVCTNTQDECSLLVERFLKERQDFVLDQPEFGENSVHSPDPEKSPNLGRIPWDSMISEEGYLRLYTHRHGCDAFFAARFRRKV